MKNLKDNRFYLGMTTTLLIIMLSCTFPGCATKGLIQLQEPPLELPTEPSFHRDAVLIMHHFYLLSP